MTQPTFESLLAALGRSGVKFTLVGGLAVAFSGFPRATFAVDILVEDSEENLRRLLSVLGGFGSGSARELTPSDFSREEGCIRVNEDFPVDIFTLMGGQTYADLLPLSQAQPVENVTIQSLGPAGLIMLKQGSVRPQDRLDVEMLQNILGKTHEQTQSIY